MPRYAALQRARRAALVLLVVAPAVLRAQTRRSGFATDRLARIARGDPVSRFIPAFAHTTVATKSDTGLVVKPATRSITIRDLLTHTAGISYGTDGLIAPLYAAKGLGPAAGWGWYTADKDEPICLTMERLATLPFAAQPGEKWVYGYNT